MFWYSYAKSISQKNARKSRRGGGIFVRSPEAVAPEFVAKVKAGRLITQMIFYVIATI